MSTPLTTPGYVSIFTQSQINAGNITTAKLAIGSCSGVTIRNLSPYWFNFCTDITGKIVLFTIKPWTAHTFPLSSDVTVGYLVYDTSQATLNYNTNPFANDESVQYLPVYGGSVRESVTEFIGNQNVTNVVSTKNSQGGLFLTSTPVSSPGGLNFYFVFQFDTGLIVSTLTRFRVWIGSSVGYNYASIALNPLVQGTDGKLIGTQSNGPDAGQFPGTLTPFGTTATFDLNPNGPTYPFDETATELTLSYVEIDAGNPAYALNPPWDINALEVVIISGANAPADTVTCYVALSEVETLTTQDTANGEVGAATPTRALLVGGTDGTDLRPFSVTPTGVVHSQDESDGTPGSAIPSLGMQVGGSDGTNLRPLFLLPSSTSYGPNQSGGPAFPTLPGFLIVMPMTASQTGYNNNGWSQVVGGTTQGGIIQSLLQDVLQNLYTNDNLNADGPIVLASGNLAVASGSQFPVTAALTQPVGSSKYMKHLAILIRNNTTANMTAAYPQITGLSFGTFSGAMFGGNFGNFQGCGSGGGTGFGIMTFDNDYLWPFIGTGWYLQFSLAAATTAAGSIDYEVVAY